MAPWPLTIAEAFNFSSDADTDDFFHADRKTCRAADRSRELGKISRSRQLREIFRAGLASKPFCGRCASHDACFAARSASTGSLLRGPEAFTFKRARGFPDFAVLSRDHLPAFAGRIVETGAKRAHLAVTGRSCSLRLARNCAASYSLAGVQSNFGAAVYCRYRLVLSRCC